MSIKKVHAAWGCDNAQTKVEIISIITQGARGMQERENHRIAQLEKKLEFWRGAAMMTIFAVILIAPAIKDIILEVMAK